MRVPIIYLLLRLNRYLSNSYTIPFGAWFSLLSKQCEKIWLDKNQLYQIIMNKWISQRDRGWSLSDPISTLLYKVRHLT